MTLPKTIVLRLMAEGMLKLLSWLNKLDLQFLDSATKFQLSAAAIGPILEQLTAKPISNFLQLCAPRPLWGTTCVHKIYPWAGAKVLKRN